MDGLLRTHVSIQERYNIARGKLENARQTFKNALNEAYHRKQAALQADRKRLEAERTDGRKRITDAFTLGNMSQTIAGGHCWLNSIGRIVR